MKNAKLIFGILAIALCLSVLLTGCNDNASQESDKERQEREEESQEQKEQSKLYSMFNISTGKESYRGLTVREEIDEKLKPLIESGIGEFDITLTYTYKFDPRVLEDNGYKAEYPEYETGYYKATIVVDADKLDCDQLYEWASDKELSTVDIRYWATGMSEIDHEEES